MDTWTRQMGFPLISVSQDGSTITANQTRFLMTHDQYNTSSLEEPKSSYGYKWYVPLSFYTNLQEEEDMIWMNMTDGQF